MPSYKRLICLSFLVLQDFAGSRSKGIAKSPYLGGLMLDEDERQVALDVVRDLQRAGGSEFQ